MAGRERVPKFAMHHEKLHVHECHHTVITSIYISHTASDIEKCIIPNIVRQLQQNRRNASIPLVRPLCSFEPHSGTLSPSLGHQELTSVRSKDKITTISEDKKSFCSQYSEFFV